MLSAARRLGLAPVRPPAPDPARRRRRALRRLRDARGGASAAVALFALGAALTLGLVADAGRAYSDRARMQAWLDGVALAAAAELDGRADAIARADWVIASAMPEMGGVFSRPESESFSVGRHVYLRALPRSEERRVGKECASRIRPPDPSPSPPCSCWTAARRR
jgi:hypothetical protein